MPLDYGEIILSIEQRERKRLLSLNDTDVFPGNNSGNYFRPRQIRFGTSIGF